MTPFAITGCGGACLPAPGGSAIDLYGTRAVLELRPIALQTLESAAASGSGWIRRVLGNLHETIARLPLHDFVAAFRPSVAFFNLHPVIRERDPVAAALSLVRFVIGGPAHAATRLVVPEEAIPAAGLYVPHLNLVLESGCGPVAAQAVGDHVRLTWTDGFAVDVAQPGVGAPPESGERFLALPCVEGWPILNPIGEAHDPDLAVAPAPATSISGLELATLGEGQELLREVWPAAYATTRRFLHSAILQPTPGDHTTSITLDFLQGTFIASCRDAVQVADALVHEGSHARLALLLRADPLLLDDGEARHVSPWRPDARPLKGVLNGVHAFLNVALFYRRLVASRADLADEARHLYETQRDKVRAAWVTCAAHASPTPLGRLFLAELGREVQAL